MGVRQSSSPVMSMVGVFTLSAKKSGEWSMYCFGFSQGMDFIQRVISRPMSAEAVWVNQLMTGY